MTNVAKINSTGALYQTVRAACDAMADNSSDGVTILSSCIGGSGFGLLAKSSGKYSLYGDKQSDGTYPVLINLGVNDSGADRLTFGKAIVNLEGGEHEFGNFTARGAEVSSANGGNGAGVRINSTCAKATGRNFQCIGNQDGLLTDGSATQELLFEDFVLDKNGFGREGYTHNAYFGYSKSVTVRRGEFLNSRFGHDLKSRSLMTVVEQCRMSGSDHGRAFDMSNGGIWESSNNEYIKLSSAEQNNLVHLAPEGVPDGRPEKYTSTNDLFSIDIPYGRGLQFIQNDGNVECVLVDPKFVSQGVEISDTDAAKFFTGKSAVRIVLTGGIRGPVKPVGCAGDIKGGSNVYTPPAAAPAPTQATPLTPAPVVAPAPAAPVADTWVKVGSEGEVVTVATNTTIRYGANGTYNTKVVSGVVALNNDVFGDPTPGVIKTAERLVAAPAAPVVAPVAAPAVQPTPQAPVVAPTSAIIVASAEGAMIAGCKAFLEALGYRVTKL